MDSLQVSIGTTALCTMLTFAFEVCTLRATVDAIILFPIKLINAEEANETETQSDNIANLEIYQ